MNIQDDQFDVGEVLNVRRKAEVLLKQRHPRISAPLSESDALRLVHELEVHQIELELIIAELTSQNKVNEQYIKDLLRANIEKENQSKLLKVKKERFQLVTRQVPGVVFQYRLRPDGTSCFPFASEKMITICGVAPEDVREDGSKAFLNIHPDDLEGIADSIRESAINLTPWQHEYRVKYEDGSIHTLYSDAIPQLEPDGSILWNGFITDITERKKTEEALRHSQERFRTVVEHSPVANIVHIEGTIIFVNPATIKMLGLTIADELLGTSIYDWIHPRFHDIVHARTMLVEKERIGNQILEIKFVRFDGQVRDSEVQSSPIIFDGLPAIHVTSNDITLRNESERKLQESEQLYHTLVESATLGILVVQGDRLRFVNPSFIELSGYSEAELLSMPFLDLISSDDQEMVHLTYVKRLNGQSETDRFQLQLVKKDKSLVWLSLRSVRIDWQGEAASLTFVADINDRILAEIENSQLALRFGLAAKAGGIGIWEFDIVNNVLSWDDRMIELFGFEKSSFVGAFEAWSETLHPEDASNVDVEFQMALNGEKQYDIEFRVIWPNGSIHYIKSIGIIQRDQSGNPLILVGSNYDITRQKEVELSLITALNNAEAANTAKSEFLANISHEIRTPLNGVIGFTDLLLKTSMDKVQEQYARNAHVSGHALLGIINDILYYVKLEEGSSPIEMVKTDIIHLVNEEFDLIKHFASQEKLELILTIPNEVPRFVFVDQAKIRRILANLLGNALKFTLSGKVELRLNFIKSDEMNGELRFSVQDTGIGISTRQQKQLFKAFSQGDNSTTRKFGGIGLGLVVSNLLARQMGSEIKLESEIGKGSCFSFGFQTSYEIGDELRNDHPATGKRILMIDDNHNRRLITAQLVRQWGLEFTGVDDLYSAITLLETSARFDAILVEYDMPDRNGTETIRMIRKNLNIISNEHPFIVLCAPTDGPEIEVLSRDLGPMENICERGNSEELFQCLKMLNLRPSLPVGSTGFAAGVKVNHGGNAAPVILVAEDIELNMMLIVNLLKRVIPSATILKAKNGREARDYVISQKVDLILMDIQMPEMSGIEATIEIRNFEKLNGGYIPIVALTAGFEKEKCIEAGMDEFMNKPLKVNMLNDLVAKYLEVYVPLK